MGGELKVVTLKPAELDAQARALWARFRDADPTLASPYFDLRYVLAAGEAAPDVEVATIRRGGEIVGFLPFQRRGSRIQPVAAPLTDYHGLIAAPGTRIDLTAVIAGLGARRFRFCGLVGGEGSRMSAQPLQAMVADLSEGFEAYLTRRPASFQKDKRRRARRLAEDHGPLAFSLSDRDDEALDYVLRLKREQLRRSGQHDVFASPWTLGFLRRLGESRDPDFGLRIAALRAGGRLVAAEVGLRSGPTHHLWFPVYDPDFARYSPGALMTLETMRAAAADGVRLVDFGPMGEPYKRDFAEPGLCVLEGDVTAGGLVAAARTVADLALASAPAARRALSEVGRRLDRRWDRIAGCEPALEGRLGAASRMLGQLARRRPKTSLGLGLGIGLSLGLAGLLAE
ncbi:MAG: GNAT family N-acetyltransferase [Phenylobacterium sp.]|uniref:GNAT family N-acetyltransferase n=1 Tax=Phenylobacterium sp. TaxID=1871053 RepID=UPI00391DFDF6